MSDETLLPDLDPDALYEGWGMDVLEGFINPALRRSVRYDRLTGFYSLRSMLAVAEGIDELWRRDGEMRLIIGIHDVPPEIAEAKSLEASDAEEVIDAVRSRLLEEVSTIEDELRRDRLATLAWMLQDGLLQIRVACPIGDRRFEGGEGIFHSKRLIFTDAEGNVLSAVGSPNETAAGYEGNIEELTVLRSWEEGQRSIVEGHIESFETIWEDGRPDLHVVDVDDSFATDILDRLGDPERPGQDRPGSTVAIDEIVETASESPAYSVLSFDNVGLYPHQERVFVEGLSRWPVRVLLADEVGLGKTLEGGAILTYLLRFGDVDEVTILAPANLLKQWHEELYLHFGLEFWRWDSTERAYIAPDGERWDADIDGDPVGPEAPPRVLISAQLARGTKKRGHIYEDADRLPDLLMVDEAHAARVRPTIDGSTRPTRLWRTLDDITDRIPHVVLMTATPLQTNLEEYHALLNLLGLPGVWEELEAYERSLQILSSDKDEIGLRDAQWMLRLMEATLEEMAYRPTDLSGSEADLVEVARQCDGNPSLEDANKVIADRSSAYDLLVRLHPAHLLTLRNSRLSLVERGYRFPERRFESPALDVPTEVERFYDGLHEYLKEAYGQVEQAADPDREISLGFAKSSYHQRTASSLHSAIRSLQNRLEKIEGIVEGIDADEDILEEEYEEPDLEEDGESETETETTDREQRKLERAKSIERAYIEGLLDRLQHPDGEGGIDDPKMTMMMDLLEQHVPEDGVLVFSRYTDTLAACLERYEAERTGDLRTGYGMYTGDEAWIATGAGRTEATKQDVKVALEDEDIRIVFCSEAAAEGLNLQAARVMINIDVPWNPAKLEQRIGRIARLGQPAEEVLIYNLWYPDSVESKMYRRLTQRKDLYDIAVGQSPEIVSNAIRSQVTSGGDGLNQAEDALEELGEIRQSMQHAAIQKVWGPTEDTVPLSTTVREELLDILARVVPGATIEDEANGRRLVVERADGERIEAGSVPEDRSILTLEHEALQLLENLTGSLADDEELLVIEDEARDVPVGFCLRKANSIAVLPPEGLPGLIGALQASEPIDELLDDDMWQPEDEVDLLTEVHSRSRWLPDHGDMLVPSAASSANDEGPFAGNPSTRLHLRRI